MKHNIKYLIIFVILLLLSSCKTARVEYYSGKFIVVEPTAGESFDSLAGKYLNDPEKGWIISEFNKIDELKPGNNVVIPLDYFNKGGLKSNGYQMIPVLNYKELISGISKTQDKVSVVDFKNQMQFFKDNDYSVITSHEFVDYIDYKIQLPEKSVVISFTGNTKSFYEIAYPVIETFGYACLLFIDPDTIGSKNEISWEKIRELSSNGVDIQLYTGLSEFVPESFKGNLKEYFLGLEGKITQSKKDMEDNIKKKCSLFAYKAESIDNILANLLRQNEFKAAFISNNKPNPFFVDNYQISRINVSGTINTDEFKKKIITFKNLDLN